MATTSNYALRLLASLKAEAEKLTALRTARYFEERASRAKPGGFDRLMAAGDEPPRPGDEVLPGP